MSFPGSNFERSRARNSLPLRPRIPFVEPPPLLPQRTASLRQRHDATDGGGWDVVRNPDLETLALSERTPTSPQPLPQDDPHCFCVGDLTRPDRPPAWTLGATISGLVREAPGVRPNTRHHPPIWHARQDLRHRREAVAPDRPEPGRQLEDHSDNSPTVAHRAVGLPQPGQGSRVAQAEKPDIILPRQGKVIDTSPRHHHQGHRMDSRCPIGTRSTPDSVPPNTIHKVVSGEVDESHR
jgi:hypothetical protein